MYKPRSYCSVNMNYFANGVINGWNSLPTSVSFTSLPTFRKTIRRVDFRNNVIVVNLGQLLMFVFSLAVRLTLRYTLSHCTCHSEQMNVMLCYVMSKCRGVCQASRVCCHVYYGFKYRVRSYKEDARCGPIATTARRR